MRSRGPISADERHSHAGEEIGARPAASGNEREGGIGGEKAGNRPRCSWSAGPRAFGSRFTPRRAVSNHPASRTRAVHAAPPRRPRSPCRRSRLHALDQPRCCSCPRRRRPASLCCSLSLCSSSLSCTSISTAASLAHVACRHLCSARARMREIRWRVAGCGAQSGAPSTALAIMLNRFCTVDEPLSGPERSKLVEEGRWVARAGGRQ